MFIFSHGLEKFRVKMCHHNYSVRTFQDSNTRLNVNEGVFVNFGNSILLSFITEFMLRVIYMITDFISYKISNHNQYHVNYMIYVSRLM